MYLEAFKGANKALRNPYSCFFISCFTISLTPLINTPESSSFFRILIILFTLHSKWSEFSTGWCSSFFSYISSNLFIALIINPAKLSLAKGIAIFGCASFCLNYLFKNKKNPPGWIILDVWAVLRFIFVDILWPKALLILLISLAVRNNSRDNSSSWKFSLEFV